MAITIEVGKTYRNPDEPAWPAVIVQSINAEPDASFKGNRLSPYAYVEWQDNKGVYTAMFLRTLETQWTEVEA